MQNGSINQTHTHIRRRPRLRYLRRNTSNQLCSDICEDIHTHVRPRGTRRECTSSTLLGFASGRVSGRHQRSGGGGHTATGPRTSRHAEIPRLPVNVPAVMQTVFLLQAGAARVEGRRLLVLMLHNTHPARWPARARLRLLRACG